MSEDAKRRLEEQFEKSSDRPSTEDDLICPVSGTNTGPSDPKKIRRCSAC